MKKTAVLSGLMALTLLLGGCSAQQAGGETPTTPPAAAATVDPAEKTTGVGFYFDTVVTITLYGADDTLMDDIWAACKRYENMLSKTVEGSDVSRINNAHGQTVTVDAETWNVLSEAKKLNRLTGGAFAITIAPLTAQWDFTGGTNRMPTDEERIAALPLVDDEQLTLGENNTVTLPDGMQIDLGGIAKGYIADQVAALVRGRCSGAMLNFGGNVYAVGTKPDGSAYRVGVQDPDEPNSSSPTGVMSVTNSSGPIGVVSVIDRSVVTSGIYERGFTIDGVRYHHPVAMDGAAVRFRLGVGNHHCRKLHGRGRTGDSVHRPRQREGTPAHAGERISRADDSARRHGDDERPDEAMGLHVSAMIRYFPLKIVSAFNFTFS